LEVRVVDRPSYIRNQRTNPFSIRLLSELRNADIVHCHQQHILSSSFAALICRLTGRKVFVSDLGGGGWDISAYTSTDRWYHGHLHISEYSRNIGGHANYSRAHVILGGVDTNRFSPDSSVEKRGHVLFVGRLLPHKGIDVLIEALPAGMELDIIGQPYDTRYLRDLQVLGEGKTITFTHDCDDIALVKAYRQALCIVLPSVYKNIYGSETRVPELLGQTLLEGMACGTPAICTDVASMPEIVEHGVTGFVVPPNDSTRLSEKIKWLQTHPSEATMLGKAARQRVLNRFRWSDVVQKCLTIYDSPTPSVRSKDV
jgi:glycosyltransferase involved in cell wall biosynthesis